MVSAGQQVYFGQEYFLNDVTAVWLSQWLMLWPLTTMAQIQSPALTREMVHGQHVGQEEFLWFLPTIRSEHDQHDLYHPEISLLTCHNLYFHC